MPCYGVVPVDAPSLFGSYFLPLYPPDAKANLTQARATDANAANNPSILTHLEDAAARFAHNAQTLFGQDLGLDLTDASVHRLSAALTPARRDGWASQGAAGTADNVLFNVVVHGAAYLGACIVTQHGGVWSVRRPLWESVVHLKSRAGEGDLAVFHWWLKSLADDSQGATLADRYRAHVEVACAHPEQLPVLFAIERALPRLAKPSYHALHQYVRARLPELRDLGVDFPAAERWDAFGLKWLEARVLGGGRMVLLAGASAKGLHLFWLTGAGFDKSVFVPCDGFPEPVVRLQDDRIVALTNEAGVTRTHEMLWWGP
jgi:hypothetical protein